MIKNLLVVISLVCLVPLAAHAWSLNTWAKTGGGSIVVRDGDPQTSVNSQIFKTYTTSQPFTVTVNANTGYKISQVNYNNVVVYNPVQTSYTVQGPTAQIVYANFAAQLLTVTALGDAGGTVSPSVLSNIYYGTKLALAKKFIFAPTLPSAHVSSITGVPAGATVSSALPAAAGSSVTVTLPVGFTFTSNIALSGSFSSPVSAIAGLPQTVRIGTLVTLDGSSSTGPPSSYLWTQTSGPGYPTTKVIADNTPGAQATFTPTVAGLYEFTLTVTGGSAAYTTITATDGPLPPPVVYENITKTAHEQCYDCHLAYGASGPGVASNVFGNWSSSIHKVRGVICAQCHNTVLTGNHPGQLRKGTVSATTYNFIGSAGSGNFCVTCHNPAIVTDFAASTHSIRAGSASCSYCHTKGQHNTIAVCTDCHKTDNTYGLAWPPVGRDFHNNFAGTNNICKVCHSTHNPKVINVKTSCTP